MSEVSAPAAPAASARRPRWLAVLAAPLAGNLAAWAWAVSAFHGHPVLLAAATLAYTLGLRHGLDADHIAAIDNVTRKLMQRDCKPVSVGLFFALGHSTVVILGCAALTLASGVLRARLPALGGGAEILGVAVSAGFLCAIALVNAAALPALYRALRGAGGERPGGTEAAPPVVGLMMRLVRPLTRFIAKPWHMYPLGVLFGLGFDTASAVGLLAVAAAQASRDIPLWSMMVLPALFTAAMSLVDTSDAAAMVGAYGWALAHPRRKLAYNLTITSISIGAALFVAALEVLALIAERLAPSGAAWRWIESLGGHFGAIGLVIVLVLVVWWGVSVLNVRLGAVADASPPAP